MNTSRRLMEAPLGHEQSQQPVALGDRTQLLTGGCMWGGADSTALPGGAAVGHRSV